MARRSPQARQSRPFSISRPLEKLEPCLNDIEGGRTQGAVCATDLVQVVVQVRVLNPVDNTVGSGQSQFVRLDIVVSSRFTRLPTC